MAVPIEGIQGKGRASVWGESPDFWRIAAMQDKKRAVAQKALEQEQALRDDLIKENRKYAPGKVWEPFYSEVADYAQKNVREFTQEMLNRNVPTGMFESERNRRITETEKLVNKANSFRDVFDNMSKRIEEDKNLNPDYYQRKVNDYFFNGRQAKPIDGINIDDIDGVFNDSKGYNMAAVATSFMKDLPQQLTEKYRKIHSDLGEQFDVSIVKSKLGIKQNADGSVVLDPRTGLPQVELTDDVTMAAIDNPYFRNYIIDNLGADAVKPGANIEPIKQLLAPHITPYDQRSIQKQHRQGFKFSEEDKTNRSGYSVPEQRVAERYDTLYRITHEHDPELLASMLPGLEDVNIGYEIYGPGESKKAPPRIKVTFPNKQWDKTDKKSPRVHQRTLSLATEEDRQAAMEFLNTILDDKLDSKQRIGENLTIYRKKKRLEEKDQGGIFEGEPAEQDERGGIY